MKVGIMGGSFNPIHMGHLMMSEYVRDELGLDEVLFVPTGNPPHKALRDVPDEERLQMVRLSIDDNPHFTISDIEIRNPHITYSVDTLGLLHEAYPQGTQFYFLLGSDIILDLKKWKKFDELAALTDFVVTLRPGFEKITMEEIETEARLLGEQFGAKVTILHAPRYEISSTDLRSRLREKKSVKYLIPDSVIDYIEEMELYR
ncbi:MAG: nicotinate-nucleotide adenylyltransferase [Tissierellia bacterium]|nr:nicotinate-nucleotide adenylyltransferase [Tissierellia bacterium]